MSAFERAYGVLKGAMLMNERFDMLQKDIHELAGDLTEIAKSHAGLAERVARIEGFLQAVGQSAGAPKLPRIEG